MQIMNAVWAEDVWRALNLVQYNEKVLSFVLRCLVYIILQPVVRLFEMFNDIKEKSIVRSGKALLHVTAFVLLKNLVAMWNFL